VIVIDSNWSRILHELDRLQHLPGDSKEPLDQALSFAKEEVKASVHVLTGALQESTTSHSKSAPHLWEGEITVGEGLGYAKYEQERKGVKLEAGTSHDFIGMNLELMHAQFLHAVKEVLEG
jgi:hypothetical protein